MSTIRILLADDHAVVREGLKTLINTQSDMEVIGEVADGLAAVAMTAKLDPDVVIVDVSMPGLNGAQVTTELRKAHADRKVLALTVHEDKSYLRLLLSAGAAGYVLKRAAAVELVQAIRVVAEGGTYLDPTMVGTVVEDFMRPQHAEEPPVVELSEREAEVVRHIALGYSNKEIGTRLKISVKTVETYKTRSLEKLGIRSRVELVQYAARRGWLERV
ncbi:MAG: response regulator transcription factor [Planctomycetes bacterium]|nr:response regulator transcription factor [Planctomycetota bacterium]